MPRHFELPQWHAYFFFDSVGDRFVDLERVVIKEFLPGQDIAQRIDEYAVVFLGGFAVRIAGMVDPTRVVAADLWIDYLTRYPGQN